MQQAPHTSTEEKESVALNSIWASLFMTFSKFFVGITTGSLGILSEAVHSLLDFASTIITFFAVRFADLPPDDNHHYGHKKIESIAALVTTGLLFATSAFVFYEAVKRIFFGEAGNIEVTWYAILIIIVSMAIDYYRSSLLMKVAKKTGSQALEADALHFQSDIWSSSVVLFGLVFVYLKIPHADSISALVVSFFIAHAGYDLGKRTVNVLTDAAPEGVLEGIEKIVKEEGLNAKHIKVKTEEGVTVLVEIGIVVPKETTAKQLLLLRDVLKKRIDHCYKGAQVIIYVESVT